MGSPGHFSCESKEPGPYQLLGREVKGLFLDCTYEQPAGILAQKITDVLPVQSIKCPLSIYFVLGY